jgi:hypothetical protein
MQTQHILQHEPYHHLFLFIAVRAIVARRKPNVKDWWSKLYQNPFGNLPLAGEALLRQQIRGIAPRSLPAIPADN